MLTQASAEMELSIMSAAAVSKEYPIVRKVSIIDEAFGAADVVSILV